MSSQPAMCPLSSNSKTQSKKKSDLTQLSPDWEFSWTSQTMKSRLRPSENSKTSAHSPNLASLWSATKKRLEELKASSKRSSSAMSRPLSNRIEKISCFLWKAAAETTILLKGCSKVTESSLLTPLRRCLTMEQRTSIWKRQTNSATEFKTSNSQHGIKKSLCASAGGTRVTSNLLTWEYSSWTWCSPWDAQKSPLTNIGSEPTLATSWLRSLLEKSPPSMTTEVRVCLSDQPASTKTSSQTWVWELSNLKIIKDTRPMTCMPFTHKGFGSFKRWSPASTLTQLKRPFTNSSTATWTTKIKLERRFKNPSSKPQSKLRTTPKLAFSKTTPRIG